MVYRGALTLYRKVVTIHRRAQEGLQGVGVFKVNKVI